MNRTLVLISAIMFACLATAGIFLWLKSDRDGSSTPSASKNTSIANVSIVDGKTIVTISPAAQSQSGIIAIKAEGVLQQQSIPAYGVVIDPQTLIDARNTYVTAQSNDAVARASLGASQKQAERLRRLLEQNAVSVMDYQAAQAAALSDEAKLNAADLALLNAEGAARSQFGEAIAHWILAPVSQEFQRLLARADSLLRVTLPLGDTLDPPPSIRIDTNDNQSGTAELVSRAAQSDPDIQGTAYIYRVHAPLATNLHVTAHMATSATSVSGIVVPSSAVIWYGGAPWVYKKTGADKFIRQQLVQPSESGKGSFVSRGFAAGDNIVIAGAQLLLSAEQMPPPSPSNTKDADDD